jgi:hypothetical protein
LGVEHSDGQPTKRAGLSRREIIKRSAIAGGVVWTAPVILDSVLSPAAAQSAPCVCTSASSYRGANIAGLGGCSGTPGGVGGFTGDGNSNACGVICWVGVNGSPNTAGGAIAGLTYNCATGLITLPSNCNWGAKGMVAVFGGGDCTGNFFVETSLPAGYACSADRGPNNAGTLSQDGGTFVLPVGLRGDLSHVNVIFCCC